MDQSEHGRRRRSRWPAAVAVCRRQPGSRRRRWSSQHTCAGARHSWQSGDGDRLILTCAFRGSGKRKPRFFESGKSCFMGRVVPQFSGLARVWAVRLRVLHCKITKNRISGRARAKKNFAGFKISAHTRPVRFVGGHGAGQARPG
jgi:hypothetical protein